MIAAEEAAAQAELLENGIATVQAGAGVVADSVPALEWKETMNKARAIFKAVDMVGRSDEKGE